MTVKNQFTGVKPNLFGGGNLNDQWGVSEITISDGVVWDLTDIAWAVSPNTNGVDGVLEGTGCLDVLDGSRGNHTLIGGDGGDIYLFNRGNGENTILDHTDYILNTAPDVVSFGEGITLDDLLFSREGDSGDLVIQLKDSPSDKLTVKGQFTAGFTGVFGTVWLDRIEAFRFSDGTYLSWDEVQNNLITQYAGIAGSDIYGFDTDDTIDIGTQGDHYVSGGNGNDVYQVSLSSGNNTIEDATGNILSGMTDTVQFAPDVDPASVRVVRDGNSNDVKFVLSNTSTLTIKNQFLTAFSLFGAISLSRIENFQFQDEASTLWTASDVEKKAIQYEINSGTHQIYGFAGDDYIDAGVGGDDYISGSDGADTYAFGFGYGHDTLRDQMTNLLSVDGDTVLFNEGVARSDVDFSRDTDKDNLIVKLSDGSALDVVGTFGPNWFDTIEYFKFQDAESTVLTAEDIKQIVLSKQEAVPNSTIYGFYGGSTLDGAAGNETLVGLDGDNTFIFGLGYGQQIVRSESSMNPLGNNFNTIQFGPGITSDMLQLSRDGIDVCVRVNGVTDTLTLKNQFGFVTNPDSAMVQQFTFSDGTVWNLSAIEQAILAYETTDPSNNVVDGYGSDDLLFSANTGSVTFNGNEGNDTITGGLGSDTLNGGDGDDILNGGSGNDLLQGGNGNNTYIFGRGYGQDTINNVHLDNGHSVLKLNADVAVADVSVARHYDDLILAINGTEDKVTIQNYFGRSELRLDSIQFTDGTTWDYQTVFARVMTGTPGDDMLLGDSGNNVLDGGAGNDTLQGNGGNDTYIFGRGYGHDTINNVHTDSGVSVLQFKSDTAPSDILFSRSGYDLILSISGTDDRVTVQNYFYTSLCRVNSITFSDGTSWDYAAVSSRFLVGTPGDDVLSGISGNDTLDGGAGNDKLTGNGGNDTYIFGRGYGQDTIINTHTTMSDQSVLKFNEDTAPGDVITRRSGDHLVLSISGTTDVATVQYYFSNWQNRIATVQFADGTSWDYQKVIELVTTGTPGNDTLIGTSGDEVLDGGAGNDTLKGNGGNDTYIFGRGYGQDIVQAVHTDSGHSVLQFNADVNPADIVVTRSSSDLVLSVAGTTDKVTLQFYFTSATYQVAGIHFSDGTVWDYQDIVTILTTGTPGNDTLVGTSGNETLDGGAGNDTLKGNGGNDTYVFGRGYGQDAIDNTHSDSGQSILRFNADTLPSDVSVTRSSYDLVFSIQGTTDQITVKSFFSNAIYRIAGVQFADGTYWNAANIVVGTAGNDTLAAVAAGSAVFGGAGNDTLTGGAGNDFLVGGVGVDQVNGGEGDDVIVLNSGDEAVGEVLDGGTGANTLRAKAADLSQETLSNIQTLELINGSTVKLAAEQLSGFGSIVADAGTGHLQASHAGVYDLSGKTVVGSLNLTGSSGDDTLIGSEGSDVLDGVLGSDLLRGNGGADQYVFGRGYGQDVIDNYHTTTDQSVLTFNADVLPGDVQMARDNDNLVLSITGTSDAVTIQNFFVDASHQVASVSFADGTIWSAQQILDATAAQTYTLTRGVDLIQGSAGSDTIIATSGTLSHDDVIDGQGGNNALVLSGAGTFDLRVPAQLDNIQSIEAQEGQSRYVSEDGSIDIASTRQAVYLRDGMDATLHVASAALDAENPNTAGITIYGANNTATINLESGNDVVYLGSAAETVNGGSGNNTFYVDATTVGATINGGSGINTLRVMGGGSVTMGDNLSGISSVRLTTASTGQSQPDYDFTANGLQNLTIYGTSGDDTITLGDASQTVSTGTGNDHIIAAVDQASAAVIGSTGHAVFEITEGGTFSLNANTRNVTVQLDQASNITLNARAPSVIGSDGDDIITAVNGSLRSTNSIDAAGGDNTLRLSGAGTFDLRAPVQLDNIQTIETQEGQTGYTSEDGSISFPSARQAVYLRDGMDATVNVASAEINESNPRSAGITIYGADNAATINLGSGDDTVYLGSASEIVNGCSGNSTFYVNSETIGATINGGSGVNRLVVKGGGEAAMGDNISGISSVYLANAAVDTTQPDYVLNVNDINGLTVYGSTGDDTITVGNATQIINGNGGNDRTIVDVETVGALVRGGSGIDTLEIVGGGTAVMNSSCSSIDIVQLDAATNLTLNRETGISVEGSSGDDIINAPAGIFSSATSIDGKDGFDTLNLVGAGTFDLSKAAEIENIELITAQEGQSGYSNTDAGLNIASTRQAVYLKDGVDTILNVASAALNTENPNAAGITIHGADNAATINLGSGNDTVYLGSALETVNGGGGNNTFYVDAATIAATIDGGSGVNTLHVTGGGVVTMGANVSGVSVVRLDNAPSGQTQENYEFTATGVGPLTIYGSSGDDITHLTKVGDKVYAGDGNDTIYLDVSSPVGSVISGGNGQNTLYTQDCDLSGASISNIQTLYVNGSVSLTGSQLSRFTSLDVSGNPLAKGTIYATSAGTYDLSTKSIVGSFDMIGSSGNDVLRGNASAQVLSSGAGNDTLDGQGGADWLDGGIGNDTYQYARGYGAGTIHDYDTTVGNKDTLSFATGVTDDQLWFSQQGDDLVVSIIGTNDAVTVKDWYSGSANHVEKIKTADGHYLLDTAVQNMVSAMASMTPPSETSLPVNYQDILNPVIAANWK
ncbi:MAG: calcium-binding protein [Bdellovibrionales bacterium]